jgi:sphingolipid delta-4 desaturase
MAVSTSTITTRAARGKAAAQLDTEGLAPLPSTLEPLEVQEQDFFWTYTEEPHRTRRMAIIKAHPEVHFFPLPSPHKLIQPRQVTKLCGPEPLTKWTVLLVVSIQILAAYSLQNTAFWTVRFWGTAYVLGATANQNLFLAIHEISHNLAFREAWKNRAVAVFANLPIGVPYSASFRVCLFLF